MCLSGNSKGIPLNDEDDDAYTIMTENYPLEVDDHMRNSLIGIIAEELCHSLEAAVQNTSSFQSIAKETVLPLLKDFSIKLRCVARHGIKQDATMFVRQQRGQVKTNSHFR